jgi:hypothetical protein
MEEISSSRRHSLKKMANRRSQRRMKRRSTRRRVETRKVLNPQRMLLPVMIQISQPRRRFQSLIKIRKRNLCLLASRSRVIMLMC